MKRTLERESKVREIVHGEASEMSVGAAGTAGFRACALVQHPGRHRLWAGEKGGGKVIPLGESYSLLLDGPRATEACVFDEDADEMILGGPS